MRIESLLLERTQHVSVNRLTIAPLGEDAWLRIRGSRHITLDHVLVTAQRTHFRATVQIAGSSHVDIRRSEFRHCGDRSPLFSNCVHLKPHTRHIQIVDNRFHDCRGCDFVHGRFGYDLTLRENRFERALPCHLSRERCRHQDLVQLWSGNRLLVEGNTFGVYRLGAAQLYLARAVDDVSIVNNVFLGSDPKVPGYRARVAIIVGSKGSKRVPLRVSIVNNTILTGAAPHRRVRGLDSDEQRVLGPPPTQATAPGEQRHRPHRGSTPCLQCLPAGQSRTSSSAESRVVAANLVGQVHLDPRGRPTAASTLLIDRASTGLGVRRDIDGRLRDSRPDIGAYEYRGTKPRS